MDRRTAPVLAAFVLLTPALMAAHSKPPSPAPRVIQGRITSVQGNTVTIRLPDTSPGGPGIRAHHIIAGKTLQIDVSRARVLYPDGEQADPAPLTNGDLVVMVLQNAGSASVVERVITGDKVLTHREVQ